VLREPGFVHSFRHTGQCRTRKPWAWFAAELQRSSSVAYIYVIVDERWISQSRRTQLPILAHAQIRCKKRATHRGNRHIGIVRKIHAALPTNHSPASRRTQQPILSDLSHHHVVQDDYFPISTVHKQKTILRLQIPECATASIARTYFESATRAPGKTMGARISQRRSTFLTR
jgi:hypothetical protein